MPVARGLAQRAKPASILVGVVLVWELVTRMRDIPRFVLPAPTQIAGYTASHLDLLFRHSVVTLREVGIAFVLAVGLGVLLAVLIARFQFLEEALLPILVTTQVVPTIAIAPLLVLWLGFGDAPKIAVAFLISFFPTLISTVSGLKSVDQDALHLARGLSATPWQILWKIRLPHSVPYIFSGAKVSITLAVIGAVVGEFVTADSGLGFLVLRGSARLETELLFAAIGFLAVIGIALFRLVGLAERLAVPWRALDAS